ncbi:hypothetical protein QM543_07305 [Pantoea eucrina]|uniref:hypothetical protein n=1 Tax=Pantoea eucrina TaxID=472693 RepID=UPI0024B6EE5F|nr:hypothetical protein [Pantoea eucrina]MDJ0023088.1 hypothetical protein [Pantoea eucrina]
MSNVIPLRPNQQLHEAMDTLAKLQFVLAQITTPMFSDQILKRQAEQLSKELHDTLYDYVETLEGR